MNKLILTTAMLSSFGVASASAHATLERQEAAVGGGYKAVVRISHGCDGKPTTTVRVKIPEGVVSAKPMPKPGWTLEKVRASYAKTYEFYGHPISEGITEVTWSGGSLADDEYDEFVFSAFLTTDLPVGEVLYFPVVQECPDGAAERWIEIPAEGEEGRDLDKPAPGLKLLEKTGGH
ncbi:DUF1775 domain-containing protein [Nitratireductor sp. CAU 1489]|uniref:DUF1775 domain-containing protein n=1 Tax=Nitratireductor arenosus TaxID=2682096 RepID=A0A844QN13_9HYPH|nr:YcnI family protein [Nitratireductor arenosus]MVA99330.1 DUF1775 domain-containing protein [Nitratireductor arenosus]